MFEIPPEKHLEILDALIRIGMQLESKALPYLVAEEIKKILGADHASVVIQEAGVARYGASTDMNWERRKPSQTVISSAFKSADGIAIHTGGRREERSESQLEQNIGSCIAARADLVEGTKAVVYCDLRSGDRVFSRTDAEFLRSLSILFAPYISSSYLSDSISEAKAEKFNQSRTYDYGSLGSQSNCRPIACCCSAQRADCTCRSPQMARIDSW